MRTFTLQQSKTEVYTPHGGLALAGHCLNRHTSLNKTARTVVKRHGIPNMDLIRTYLGLITLGKSDFEAVESVRTDPFFKSAMGIKQAPSSARLRQRFDEDAKLLIPVLEDASGEFLASIKGPVTPLAMGHVALDMDVFSHGQQPDPQGRRQLHLQRLRRLCSDCGLFGSGRLVPGL